MEPTAKQAIALYKISNWITERLHESITIVRLDERTQNIYIQFGGDNYRFFLITPDGEITQDEY
ncbi:MAG: hypothetical protein AAGD25_38155 [Cyanobacteria bacterium P01_F01_bin.150]